MCKALLFRSDRILLEMLITLKNLGQIVGACYAMIRAKPESEDSERKLSKVCYRKLNYYLWREMRRSEISLLQRKSESESVSESDKDSEMTV